MAAEFGFDSIDDGRVFSGLECCRRGTVYGLHYGFRREEPLWWNEALPGPILSWSQSFVLVWYCFRFSESGFVLREPEWGPCCFVVINWTRAGLLGGGPGYPSSRDGGRIAPLGRG